ncbi:PASTA domain-containing protein [Nocardia callitridis]|uniref:PASTA domain-containing protein n=1 Tax=Nocardia callitridis TaxID=648753 RepID=A0ABP9JYR1_9NOCA
MVNPTTGFGYHYGEREFGCHRGRRVAATLGAMFAASAMALTTVGCAAGEPTPVADVTSVVPTAAVVSTLAPTSDPVPSSVQAPPPAPVATSEQQGAERVPMPNVVCMNLQDAQNAIQAAGVWYSRSADATGAGRRQVVDRNWIVVSQTPEPGVPVGEGDALLSAVKVGEPNPCG